MKRVSGDRVPSSKNENKNKIRASMRNLAVVCPILGIAWVFGVLSMSFNHVAFQYVFAIANSAQGLLVFIFHVILRQKKGKQGSLIWNLLRCVRRKSISSTSASGLNTAAEKLATVAGKNQRGKEKQEETQIDDSG